MRSSNRKSRTNNKSSRTASRKVYSLTLEEDPNNADFPEYANEQNKQLNQIIKEKRSLNKEIYHKLMDRDDRTKILKDHLKNVQYELLHT